LALATSLTLTATKEVRRHGSTKPQISAILVEPLLVCGDYGKIII
jgi:hypothetical protein